MLSMVWAPLISNLQRLAHHPREIEQLKGMITPFMYCARDGKKKASRERLEIIKNSEFIFHYGTSVGKR